MTFPGEPTRKRPGDQCAQALFCLVQYHVDRSRQEGVNVGVVFVSDHPVVDVRILTLPPNQLAEVAARLSPMQGPKDLEHHIRAFCAMFRHDIGRFPNKAGIEESRRRCQGVPSINGIELAHYIGATIWDDPEGDARRTYEHLVMPMGTAYPEEPPQRS